MSNIEVIQTYEAEILELHEKVAIELDDLRQRVCAVAKSGADLGDHVGEFRKQTKLKGDDELWARLQSLSTAIREDVIRFALRSSNARRRGMLDDPSQLTFALMNDAGDTPHSAPATKQASNEAMMLTQQLMRTAGFVREWSEKLPIKKWDDVVKTSVRESLRPLVELYEQLQ